MQVGNTSTGETINLDDNPFDTLHIIIPKLNITWNATPDMGTGNTMTLQGSTNSMTNTPDWNSNSHFNHSNARNGQGNVAVLRGSNTDKLFLKLYNAVNPLGQNKSSRMINGAKNCWFDIVYGNTSSGETVRAEGCFFQQVAQFQANNGSNNSQDQDSWTYLATTVYRDEGDLTNQSQVSQNGDQINGALNPIING